MKPTSAAVAFLMLSGFAFGGNKQSKYDPSLFPLEMKVISVDSNTQVAGVRGEARATNIPDPLSVRPNVSASSRVVYQKHMIAKADVGNTEYTLDFGSWIPPLGTYAHVRVNGGAIEILGHKRNTSKATIIYAQILSEHPLSQ